MRIKQHIPKMDPPKVNKQIKPKQHKSYMYVCVHKYNIFRVGEASTFEDLENAVASWWNDSVFFYRLTEQRLVCHFEEKDKMFAFHTGVHCRSVVKRPCEEIN